MAALEQICGTPKDKEQMKNILITGGSGFVGANLSLRIKEKYPSYNIFALDNLKRRGSELNLPALKRAGITFIHGDIRNKEDLDFKEDIDLVIDAAAEPSVLAGMDGSTDYLVQTNFNGTINALNLALRKKAGFIFLSTSRVYPIHSIENIAYHETDTRFEINAEQTIAGISVKGISEKADLNGMRSLYGSSKLASELFVKEYQELFGIKAVINRCGVITGPYQMGKVDQGVIVLWMARHFWKRGIQYIGYGGSGKQVRDIMHIDDLFDLIDYQMHNMEQVNGRTFNAGGGREVSVSLKELSALCSSITGNKVEETPVLQDRPGDIRIYITDNTAIHAHTGWKPKRKVETILTDIFDWIKTNERELKPVLDT